MALSTRKLPFSCLAPFLKGGGAAVLTLALCVSARAQPTTAGSALHFFNGQESYVDIPGFGNEAPTNEITIEFWQRAGLFQEQATFSLTPFDGTNSIDALVPWADGMVYWDFGNASAGGRLSYTPPVTVVGSWQHFAFVASQSGNYMAIYRNGAQEAYQTGMTPFVPYAADLTLGTLLDFGFYFCGDLDEVRIWNVARSQSDIRNTMHLPLVGDESGLVAYWRFDEGSGTTTDDATVNDNTGTLENSPAWVGSTAPCSIPVITLNGPNPMTNECHFPFVDPGATAIHSPISIADGEAHCLAVKGDGTVVGWGSDTYGQIDVPANATNVIAVAAGGFHSMALRADGTVIAWGDNDFQASGANVVAIAAGKYTSYALVADGSALAFDGVELTSIGYVGFSLIGISAGIAESGGQDAFIWLTQAGTEEGPVPGVAGGPNEVAGLPAAAINLTGLAWGENFGVVLRGDGAVFAWGDNSLGQCDIPAFISPPPAIAVAAGGFQVGYTFIGQGLALVPYGTAYGWGGTGNPFPATLSPRFMSAAGPCATNVIAIAQTFSHLLGLCVDGTVLADGENMYGQNNIPSGLNSIRVTVAGTVNTNVPGTYYLTYSSTNVFGVGASVTRTVVVVDTTPPTVTLVGANPLLVVAGVPFVDPGATASDLCAGDLTGSIQVSGTVNPAVPGNYNLLYVVSDPSGNVGTTNRAVWVIPAEPYPTATAPLRGALNPDGLDTMVYFQYGLSTSYGSSTMPQDIGSGSGPVPFNATITGLLPGTTYHYRQVSTNSNGTVYGPDMTFTTSPYLVPGDVDGDGIVDQIDLGIVMGYYWPLAMTNVSGLSTTNIQFVLAYTNNWDLNAFVSTNLLDWSFLGPAFPLYQFSDPAATSAPQRYYRLRWP